MNNEPYDKCHDEELLAESPFTCFICRWAPRFFFVVFLFLFLLFLFGCSPEPNTQAKFSKHEWVIIKATEDKGHILYLEWFTSREYIDTWKYKVLVKNYSRPLVFYENELEKVE